jgi:hypothetical protein
MHGPLVFDGDPLVNVSEVGCSDEVTIPVSNRVADDRLREPRSNE